MKGCTHSWLPSLISVCINISLCVQASNHTSTSVQLYQLTGFKHDLIFTNWLSNKYLNPRQGREGIVVNEQSIVTCVRDTVRMCACV